MNGKAALSALLVIFFLVPLVLSGPANADIVSGSMELDYGTFDSVSTDAAGNTMRMSSRDFNQLYNAYLRLTPLPTLNVMGGVNVGKDSADFTTNGTMKTTSSTTSVRPSLEATLTDPFGLYIISAGYSKLENTSRGSNAPTATLVNEDTHAIAAWRPVGFPTLEMRVARNGLYDREHVNQDLTTDSVLLSSQYKPRTTLDLSYQAGYSDSQDRINHMETTTITQNGRVNYSDSFAGQRVAVNTGYSVAVRGTSTETQGAGTVTFQLFPIAVLYSVSDSPLMETLTSSSTLPANSINIGSSAALSGDTHLRETGLDFSVETEVNNILLLVDRQVTPEIAKSFSWDIYTSPNNLNWTLVQTVSGAPFGPFINRFSIDFQNVKARYLKVVTRPLSLAVPGATNQNFQNIYVTDIQATIQRPATEVKGENNQASHMYNLNVRTRIQDSLNLYHDLAFNLVYATATGAPSTTRYVVTNGLSLMRRFNPVFSGSARTAWETSHDQNGVTSNTISYNAVVTATPLPTLRSSLVYGGQIAAREGTTSNNNAVSLNTTAELYPGVNLNTSAGAVYSESETGIRSTSTSFLAGAGFVPHRALTLNINYSQNRSQSAGTDQAPGTASARQRWEAAAVYRPFETAYVTASISRQAETGKPAYTLRNYGFNWSPFPDGNLQFHFLYNENMRSDSDTREKLIGPGLSWLVFHGASLDVSYLTVRSDSPMQTSEIKSLNLSYRMAF